jgi:hypothetical protein
MPVSAAAKLESRVFLVLFWGGSAKKELRRKGISKTGARTAGSTGSLFLFSLFPRTHQSQITFNFTLTPLPLSPSITTPKH